MYKKSLLSLNHFQLLKAFSSDFPSLLRIARESRSSDLFKHSLLEYLNRTSGESTEAQRALADLKRLIEYDGALLPELSTGEKLSVDTFSCLWHFLIGDPLNRTSTDLLLDLYHLFAALLPGQMDEELDLPQLKRQMSRWPSGANPLVQEMMAANKTRMIPLLVEKVERKQVSGTRYRFEPGMSPTEKEARVVEWWNLFQFHLSMAIKDPLELNLFLGNTLGSETLALLLQAKRKGIPFFITPYYLSLLNVSATGYDDYAVRSYILYSKELIDTFGTIKAWEKEDVVVQGEPNAAGWLLPDGHNIHRRYPEVAILIPDSMGRACGGICASCQRMYGFQSKQLNFDFEALKPKESWDGKLRRLMEYFEYDAQLRDLLITGGDALMSQDSTLRKLLDAVYKMAIRKNITNASLPDGEKLAGIQRIRLGSRLLAYLPMRVSPELVEILREFREKAMGVGMSQFIVQTHFQSPLELTPEALKAIRMITSAGWIVTNQLVYTVAASRRGHTAKLRKVLNQAGVMCYYTFSVKGFHENYTMFTPNSRSLQEQQEEKAFGKIMGEKRDKFLEIIRSGQETGKPMSAFLKEYDLPFVASDRNVLNLPAIGKSMTFCTVGITREGKRILKFGHDSQRRHSPVIDQLGEVYIVENKSIAAYLRQLEQLGENLREYESIWRYTGGETEPRFGFYEYPSYPYRITKQLTNFTASK